jgi:hypothetical protein
MRRVRWLSIALLGIAALGAVLFVALRSRDAQGSELVVHVVDERAQPVAGIPMALRFESQAYQPLGNGAHGVTGADGTCRLDPAQVAGDRAPWIRVLVDEPAGYADGDVRVPVATRLVEVALQRCGRLWGRVAYADGSAPSEARLFAYFRAEDGSESFTFTNVRDGQYDFGHVLPRSIARLELASGRRSYSRLVLSNFTIDPGADVQRDLVFDLGSTLELR